MWIKAIFAREFGFSDVQSNYSRVYAWMANQLGHMTLGMATAFFFVWIADTIGATARLIVDWEGRPRQAANGCEFAFACVANNILLFVAAFVIIGAICAICIKGAFDAPPPISADVAARYRAIAPRARQAMHGVFFVLAALTLGYLLSRALGMSAPEDRERLVELIGVTTAVFAIGAGVLMLCHDIRYFTFALLAVFGAFWIATNGAGAVESVRRWIAVALALLFFVYAMRSLVIGADIPEKLGGLEKLMQGAVVAIIALWFVSGTWHGLEGDWPMAIAAAIASCALWWVKEFASDLPNVHHEIADAARKRPKNVLGACKRVERDYIDDARMDARTDGMFYFAGAWIGAGVLSDTPVMTTASWPSGSEVMGLLVFLAIFLGLGKTWAFRQQALDFAGLDKASRLAVFHAALRIVVIPAEQPLETGRAAPAPELPYLPEPLDRLRDFARATEDPGFDHLIVFGALGSGRTPLGRALASEAALADLPTLGDRITLGAATAEKARRTGRYIVARKLVHFMRDISGRTDVVATPTVDLLIEKASGDVVRRDGEFDPATHELVPAANLVVIDDFETEQGLTPRALAANLALAAGQQTAWLIADGRFDPTNGCSDQTDIDAWTPDYRTVEDELAAIRAALTVDGLVPRLGVGFTRRFSSPARR
ncbi:hypothetical protein G5B40_17325 [Pikeienuella piscinae]|uniref:Uncharacterized protein n=1 Tax=Pikeienuella piscinae TaxID=2748098 RepID=A0A7L5BYP5_9RHOB|nr:hypothetical protein [Pikeienuella piscinae]QIE57045.1 hypothetical protein G5B40_17325 [Pikeienuella piscinae]